MVIGEDIPLRINDHACSQPFEFPLELPGHIGIAEKATEERVVSKRRERIFDLLAFGDFDMRQAGIFCFATWTIAVVRSSAQTGKVSATIQMVPNRKDRTPE